MDTTLATAQRVLSIRWPGAVIYQLAFCGWPKIYRFDGQWVRETDTPEVRAEYAAQRAITTALEPLAEEARRRVAAFIVVGMSPCYATTGAVGGLPDGWLV